MNEKPIQFDTEMINAILSGKKTVTRSPINPQPKLVIQAEKHSTYKFKGGLYALNIYTQNSNILKKCPLGQIGDRLWVKEKWCFAEASQGWSMDENQLCQGWISYKTGEDREVTAPNFDAVESLLPQGWDWDFIPNKYFSAKSMPRWASRLLLEIKSVRVERLQDISELDAIAEGMKPDEDYCAEQLFSIYWNKKHGWKEKGWNANPWVWVIEFKVVEGDN